MQHQLYGLRGKVYVKKLKELYAELGPLIQQDFNQIIESTGKFTPLNLGELCIKHRIPVTVMDDWLSTLTAYPTGTWENLRSRGCKARDIGVVWK
ncbi:hypothetical protein NG799_01775 [Laspinema sp. D1]|uniref:Uncharacterized protein n=2 Tax=Laspinema TaxID=2584823 RepID=A0ABT2MJZ3_9CYAN|nr:MULTISPECIES: hypothetical protein [unclassified Laspinema]MCT7965060.1 hypothetical protein [Laspinema sp. D2a]MCT7977653.1 hypothetical protein [Laspinema sp. D3b]MCT7992499.1 hypothetical protein [Laspinema sp. D3c]